MGKELDPKIEANLTDAMAKVKSSLAGEALEASTENELDESEATDTAQSEESLQTSPTSEDVKDDVKEEDSDDKGVPYKNRYHETVRKLKKQDEVLADLQAKVAALTQQSEEQTVFSLRGTGNDNAFDSTGVSTIQGSQRPQETYYGSEEPEATATKKDVHQIVAKLTAKERNDQEALKLFPDLKDRTSILFKETSRMISEKRMRGADPTDPNLVLETAAAAFGAMVATGKLSPKASRIMEETSRREGVDSSTIVTSRASVKQQAAPKLTSMQERVLKQFRDLAGVKMSDEEYLKRATRRNR